MYCDFRAWVALSLSMLITTQCAFADGLLPPKKEATPIEASQPSTPEPVKVSAVVPNKYPTINISSKVVPLNSRIKNTYTGYHITVSNDSTSQVELLHGDVVNGVTGQGAALGAQKSSAAVIGGLIGGGLILGIVTFGITFLAGLIASPIVYAANHRGNTKAIAEGNGYANQVSTGILPPGDNFLISTLIPVGQKPQVKLTFRDLATNEIFSVSR